MPNATAIKFGHPASVVLETPMWSVQARPAQVTLGSLVLVCKEEASAFGQLSAGAFADLGQVVGRTEAMLGAFVGYQRINYLMLMMVDPDVHFHVIPRYEGVREHGGRTFADGGWPGPPALGEAVTLSGEALEALVAALRAAEPRS